MTTAVADKIAGEVAELFGMPPRTPAKVRAYPTSPRLLNGEEMDQLKATAEMLRRAGHHSDAREVDDIHGEAECAHEAEAERRSMEESIPRRE